MNWCRKIVLVKSLRWWQVGVGRELKGEVWKRSHTFNTENLVRSFGNWGGNEDWEGAVWLGLNMAIRILSVGWADTLCQRCIIKSEDTAVHFFSFQSKVIIWVENWGTLGVSRGMSCGFTNVRFICCLVLYNYILRAFECGEMCRHAETVR